MMNITFENIRDKLSLGEMITYKEVTERLAIPYYNSGNQKKAQLKELKRFIEYEVVNRKWLITDIYSSPLDKETRAVPSNSIYVKYVECILLQFLSEQHGNEAFITKNKLWLLLGMVNDNYLFYKDKYEDLKNLNSLMTSFEVNNFYQRSSSYLSKIVESSLNSLKRRYLIDYNEVYMINTKDKNGMNYSYEASIIETEKILVVKRNTLMQFGIEHEGQLIFKDKKFKQEYYKALDTAFNETCGWDKVYRAYHIIYNRKNALTALSHDQIELEKLAINERVVDKMNSQAKVIAEENNEHVHNNRNIISEKTTHFMYPDIYVEVQKMLSERLIRIKNDINL